ncbi:MAG: branched-chain amino acid ABC transporter permease, partial [Desulfobulbaceae bacterium A2]
MSGRQRLAVALVALGLALLPLWVGLSGNQYLLTLASRILIYALAAVSLDLLLGYGKLISLGHAAFVGIGAYVAGILSQHAL